MAIFNSYVTNCQWLVGILRLYGAWNKRDGATNSILVDMTDQYRSTDSIHGQESTEGKILSLKDLNQRPMMVNVRGIIPVYGRTVQVSEFSNLPRYVRWIDAKESIKSHQPWCDCLDFSIQWIFLIPQSLIFQVNGHGFVLEWVNDPGLNGKIILDYRLHGGTHPLQIFETKTYVYIYLYTYIVST